MTPLRRRAALALLAAPAFGRAAPLPGDSIYQLQATLTDQDGRRFEWSSLRGRPLLASMFYASCEMVCPTIFETIHLTLKALPASDRAPLGVLMVSFDSARDSTEVLKKTAADRHCDARWTLARADEATVRKVAAVLGVQYRRLDSGEFNHSTVIEHVDAEGRIVARSGKLGGVDAALVKSLRAKAG